jgi:hypothetical protein
VDAVFRLQNDTKIGLRGEGDASSFVMSYGFYLVLSLLNVFSVVGSRYNCVSRFINSSHVIIRDSSFLRLYAQG